MPLPTTSRKPHLALVVILLAAFLWLSLPLPAGAQNEVSFESVLVDIWPEYDQPSVLVIYHITLAPEVSLPANVTIRIPSAAGSPHAVAMQDVAGLYNLNYETAAAGEWQQIAFTTPVPQIVVEYYDPTLTKEDGERSFTYQWPGDYTVKNLTLQVQQPVNASAITFRPDMGSGRKAEDGLTYYNLVAGRVDAGTSFDLEFSYDKPDETLTNPDSFEPVQPVEPVDNTTTGRVTLNEMLPWALGGVGVLLIVVGVWWYIKTGHVAASPQRARHAPRRPAVLSETGAAQDEKEGVYCHQCGKRAAPGDLFCRVCGTKLR